MSGSTSSPGPRTAVVIGGSLAGMLTAAALSAFADVVVVERDALPDGPESRKGLPQAHHAHLLWSGGARAIDTLLPGTVGRLLDGGAHRIALPTNMVGYSPEGWFRRWSEQSHYVVLASRDLLDWHIRRSASALPRVTVTDRTEVLNLEGDARRVTGVRVRGADGRERVLAADLLVDASGRASRTPAWLGELGVPAAAVRTVDPGLVYASRTFRAPKGLGTAFPVIVNVQANPRETGPGQSATLVPIEGDRWLVTLSGTRGGEPTKDPAVFEAFARAVRHPIVGELIAQTQPLTDVVVTRTTVNRRHAYEKAALPGRFVVLGDATAAYNPVYGHGMSVAAQSALALRDTVARLGWYAPHLGARAQKAVAGPVAAAWALSTGNDVFYPGAAENGPTLAERLSAAYVRRLLLTSTGNGRVARAVTDVMTLERPAARLFTPPVLLAAALGPRREQLSRPPLRTAERAAISSIRP
ncbi:MULTISPECIES: FAD-dependent monooxygenase [unclassified Streptomyces]|uniref:FAD-dependent monooxygenase n=1 Tax=unclassified Streptomyces TaxID=2593676 RepID=UPI001BE75F0F|nr:MULTISPECIES: FAD-dependent monooxygenase [unclassified Streptomyces]MBT2408725.1 FAD-dependent monooxygenase [Streptomyces sp. ISL-21]MBT2613726.1 FAD-dependent monooxygenase [Streptomyces sp. ISL-87]